MSYLRTQSDMPDKILDPYEAQLGLKHRDVIHMLEILSDPQAPIPNRLKALRMLKEVLPGNQQHADQYNAIEILTPYLSHAKKSLVLNAVSCFNTLIITENLAEKMVDSIPVLIELVNPEEEIPMRYEAAHLLRIIADFLGPVTPFLSGRVPNDLVEAVSSRYSDQQTTKELFGLLARLSNKQTIRVPLMDSHEFLTLLVRSFSNIQLRSSALILASNIAMDPSNKGKIALLSVDILASVAPFLESTDVSLRYAILSLLCLVTVPKEGKHRISTDRDLPDVINTIAKCDEDERCRAAASELRTLIAELPLGKAIMGGDKHNNGSEE